MHRALSALRWSAVAMGLTAPVSAQQITRIRPPQPLPAPTACPTSDLEYAGGQFGVSVTTLDFDGDGHLDLAVGEPGQDAAHVFLGPDLKNGTVLSFTRAGLVTGTLPLPVGDRFGSYVAAGDIDGLPGEELLIGAPRALGGRGDVSIVSYGGGVAQLTTGFDGVDVRKFGNCIAVADVDRDGLADVIVGAPGTRFAGLSSVGSLHVYSSLLDGERLLRNPALRDGVGMNGNYGAELQVDDVDGDGWDDLYVAASGNPTGRPGDFGAVYLHMSPVVSPSSEVSPDPVRRSDPDPLPCEFGSRLGKAIDARDGVLLVGAPRKESRCESSGSPQQDAGGVIAYFGADDRRGQTLEDPSPSDSGLFGFNVVLADVVESPAVDIVVASLDDEELLVWSGGDLTDAPLVFRLPQDARYWATAAARGNLALGNGPREELVFGDPRAEDCAGRVLLLTFREDDSKSGAEGL